MSGHSHFATIKHKKALTQIIPLRQIQQRARIKIIIEELVPKVQNLLETKRKQKEAEEAWNRISESQKILNSIPPKIEELKSQLSVCPECGRPL